MSLVRRQTLIGKEHFGGRLVPRITFTHPIPPASSHLAETGSSHLFYRLRQLGWGVIYPQSASMFLNVLPRGAFACDDRYPVGKGLGHDHAKILAIRRYHANIGLHEGFQFFFAFYRSLEPHTAAKP